MKFNKSRIANKRMNSNEFLYAITGSLNHAFDTMDQTAVCEYAKKILQQIQNVERIIPENKEYIQELQEEVETLRKNVAQYEDELEEKEWLIDCYKIRFGDLDDSYEKEEEDTEE